MEQDSAVAVQRHLSEISKTVREMADLKLRYQGEIQTLTRLHSDEVVKIQQGRKEAVASLEAEIARDK